MLYVQTAFSAGLSYRGECLLVCKSNPVCLCLNSQPYLLNEVELLSLKINTVMYIEGVSGALCLWELKKCPSAVLILTFLFLEKSIFTTVIYFFFDRVSCNGVLKDIYIYVCV